VEEWAQKGMLNMQNCFFLDDSGFDINMHHSRAWPQCGTQAIMKLPSARAFSHTIIGTISAFGVVVNVSIGDSKNVKKGKIVGAIKRKAAGDAVSAIPKGTTASHYVQFISDTLNIMNKFPNMKGFHLVMDNCSNL
jgi:hypothetical protein